jgi:hypothetical protein
MVWWTMDQMSGCCVISQYHNTHSSDKLFEQNHIAIILWWWYEMIWGTWIFLTCRTKIRDEKLKWFKTLLCGNRSASETCFAAIGPIGFPNHPHQGKEYPMVLSLFTFACNDLKILWSWGLQIRIKCEIDYDYNFTFFIPMNASFEIVTYMLEVGSSWPFIPCKKKKKTVAQ